MKDRIEIALFVALTLYSIGSVAFAAFLRCQLATASRAWLRSREVVASPRRDETNPLLHAAGFSAGDVGPKRSALSFATADQQWSSIMSRNFGVRRQARSGKFSSWPMWVVALFAIGVIDIAVHLPRP